jgi:hypothetical protein
VDWLTLLLFFLRIGSALTYFAQYFAYNSPLYIASADSEFYLWNTLSMSCSSNPEVLTSAAGRQGLGSATEAYNLLLSRWVTTAEARRTVLHAAQVYARAKDTLPVFQSGPWTLPMFLGPFQAALVLCLYSVLLPYVSGSEHELDALELSGQVDWAAVGGSGMAGQPGDSGNDVARWIMHGEDGLS